MGWFIAAAAIGYSIYSTSKAKSEASSRVSQVQSQLPETPSATETTKVAEEQAKASTKQKKRAIARSRTVFTSPLGLQEEATTAKKTLLGA